MTLENSLIYNLAYSSETGRSALSNSRNGEQSSLSRALRLIAVAMERRVVGRKHVQIVDRAREQAHNSMVMHLPLQPVMRGGVDAGDLSHVELDSKHLICGECLARLADMRPSLNCPMCRVAISDSFIRRVKMPAQQAERTEDAEGKLKSVISKHAVTIASAYISHSPDTAIRECADPLPLRRAMVRVVKDWIRDDKLSISNFMDRMRPGSSIFNSIIQATRAYAEEQRDLAIASIASTTWLFQHREHAYPSS